MKTNLFATIIFSLTTLLSVSVKAATWRVNNNATGTYGENLGGSAGFPIFKQIQDANNSNLVNSGDTIYVEGSTVRYNGAGITKRLVIIGTGYFLSDNPKTSADNLTSRAAGIDFNTNSEGSQLIAMHIGDGNTAGVGIYASNITVKRCRIDAAVHMGNGLVSDIVIAQNFFYGKSTGSLMAYNSASFPSYVVFNNNICQKALLLPDNPTYILQQCNNNVFDCPVINNAPSIRIHAGTFQNNILKTTAAVAINGGSLLNVTYNIGTLSSQFGTDNENKVVSDMSTIFLNTNIITTDSAYQLKAGVAASYPGSDGTARGAFGGAAIINRYTLSGLAAIPVIYEVTTIGVATPTGLPVTIKARTIK